MRRIGLLGGMSWESSSEYYRLLNLLVRDRLGGLHSADCLMYSVDFAADRRDPGRGAVGGRRQGAGHRRQGPRGGRRGLLLLCTNTMHLVADQVQAAVSIPLLHLIDVTARRSARPDSRTSGCSPPAFTMEGGFYVERMAPHGMTARVPDPEDRAAGAPGHLRGALCRQGLRRVAGGVPGRDRAAGRRTARRAWCSAAPRSSS